MKAQEPAGHVLDAAFAAYRAATLAEVRVPGADDVRRRTYRRQQAKMAVTAALAVAAIAVSPGTYLRTPSSGGPSLGAAASSTSADATTGPAPEATASPVVPATSGPPPSFALSSAALDLVISGPSEVTLTPSGGRYAGTLKVIAANVGVGVYDFGIVRVTLPSYVEMTFQGVASPGMSACLIQSPPGLPAGLRVWECTSDVAVIPARGGQTTYTMGLAANISPQRQQIEMDGARIQVVARGPGNKNNNYFPVDLTDATPANNELAVKLILVAS